MLRRMFGTKRDGMVEVHHGEPHEKHSSPNIIRTIKLTRMRGAGNIACMGREECI
jgi:hypothetical protein